MPVFIYRLAFTLAAPLIALLLAWRVLRGRESIDDLRERFGGGPAEAETGPLIWLHGASNGELTSARDLIETLLRRDPTQRLLVTANSVTGRDMVRGWDLPRLQARLAPLDYRTCLSRFLARHRPTLFVLLEGDLWPNRMAMADLRGLPVAMLSARISARSAGKWRRRPGIARRMFRAVRLLSAQDKKSEQRLREIGVPASVIVPPLTFKASVKLDTPDPALLSQYGGVFSRGDTLLAASTHDGEESQVLEAFQKARVHRPALKLILAPRHPPRGPEVASLLRSSGLSFGTRSEGDPPDPNADVYLADTLGEMPLWYALSGQCFVGGSLVPKGGHTPYEPAQFDCAILHGPDLRNFADAYTALDAAGGAIAVSNAAELGTALANLNPDAREKMTRAARKALAMDTGAQLGDLVTRVLALSRENTGSAASR